VIYKNKKDQGLLTLVFFVIKSLRTEESVSRVTETGKDISVLVETSVKGRNVDIDVGMRLGNSGNSLGSTDYCHKLDMLTTSVLEKLYCVARASTRCKHRIYNYDQLILYSDGKLAIIGLRLKSLLVSVHTDMSDLSERKQNVDTVYHSQTRAKYGNYNYRIIGNNSLSADLKRGLDLDLGGGYTLFKALIGHQRGYLLHQLTKFLHTGTLVTEYSYLVTDKGMIKDYNIVVIFHFIYLPPQYYLSEAF